MVKKLQKLDFQGFINAWEQRKLGELFKLAMEGLQDR